MRVSFLRYYWSYEGCENGSRGRCWCCLSSRHCRGNCVWTATRGQATHGCWSWRHGWNGRNGWWHGLLKTLVSLHDLLHVFSAFQTICSNLCAVARMWQLDYWSNCWSYVLILCVCRPCQILHVLNSYGRARGAESLGTPHHSDTWTCRQGGD